MKLVGEVLWWTTRGSNDNNVPSSFPLYRNQLFLWSPLLQLHLPLYICTYILLSCWSWACVCIYILLSLRGCCKLSVSVFVCFFIPFFPSSYLYGICVQSTGVQKVECLHGFAGQFYFVPGFQKHYFYSHEMLRLKPPGVQKHSRMGSSSMQWNQNVRFFCSRTMLWLHGAWSCFPVWPILHSCSDDG